MLRTRGERRCSYVVLLESECGPDRLREIADTCSLLARHGAEPIVVDGCGPEAFAKHRRVLQWVARHVDSSHEGPVDGSGILELAMSVSASEKIIVATAATAATIENVEQLCALLEEHEVVVAQPYVDPLPWWGTLDAGGLLLLRATGSESAPAPLFAFRRRPAEFVLRYSVGTPFDETATFADVAFEGLEVHRAGDVFARWIPDNLHEWLGQREASAARDLQSPERSFLFLALLPALLVVLLLGGAQLAVGYAAAVVFVAIAVAFRGRTGAAAKFPCHACLAAPLWLVERSLAIYACVGRRAAHAFRAAAPASATQVDEKSELVRGRFTLTGP